MSELLFDFQEMANEIDSFANLASKFIAQRSQDVLPTFRRDLELYRDQPTVSGFDWEISTANPLVTEVSRGEYEKDANGEHNVFAEISTKWRIRRVPPTKKSMRAKEFKLIGIASTRVRLMCEGSAKKPATEIAMWRMEIGDGSAPGCHFHVQILGDKTEFPFPKSLSVPRLPGLILTPAAATEFALAELFQDEWAKHVGRDSADLDRWAPIQRQRLVKLLNWKLSILDQGGSPWTTLKQQKPHASLFVNAAL